MHCSLLKSLLKRNDKVYIYDGKLVIEPNSTASVPENWLAQHRDELVSQILQAVGIDCFVYVGYSTGKYQGSRFPGITLQFESLLGQEDFYCIFNAITVYQRGKKAGQPLPKGKFSISKRSKFYRFWRNTGLPVPAKLSIYHDYMGNLRPLLFTAKCISASKLDKNSIKPLNVTYEQIIASYALETSANHHTGTEQHTDNSQTTLPYSDLPQSQEYIGMQPFQSTGAKRCDISNKDSEVKGNTTNSNIDSNTGNSKGSINQGIKKAPQDQTHEEWLKDYDSG